MHKSAVSDITGSYSKGFPEKGNFNCKNLEKVEPFFGQTKAIIINITC